MKKKTITVIISAVSALVLIGVLQVQKYRILRHQNPIQRRLI